MIESRDWSWTAILYGLRTALFGVENYTTCGPVYSSPWIDIKNGANRLRNKHLAII